jgi:hypothetical protein
VDKDLAQLAKGGAASAPGGKQRSAAKPAAKKARNQVAAKPRKSGGASIESVVIDLLRANGAPMAFRDVLATIKKKKLVKTKVASFDGVLRQAMAKSSRIKRVSEAGGMSGVRSCEMRDAYFWPRGGGLCGVKQDVESWEMNGAPRRDGLTPVFSMRLWGPPST